MMRGGRLGSVVETALAADADADVEGTTDADNGFPADDDDDDGEDDGLTIALPWPPTDLGNAARTGCCCWNTPNESPCT
jgi:hypothetical protein